MMKVAPWKIFINSLNKIAKVGCYASKNLRLYQTKLVLLMASSLRDA